MGDGAEIVVRSEKKKKKLADDTIVMKNDSVRSDASRDNEDKAHNTSLQRLQNVERRVVRVLDIAGGVMEELVSPSCPKKEFINSHCREFMQLIKDIQVILREEITSVCEYRPFEKLDYNARIANEICFQKLESVLTQLDDLNTTAHHYPPPHL